VNYEVAKRQIANILNEEYLSRSERNANYSLRGFARSLRIDPSLLLRIMRGERKPRKETIQRLFERLDLDAEQIEELYFNLSEAKANEKILEERAFAPIAKWYYFAILDLFHLPDFENSEGWMAKRLNVPEPTLSAALRVLRELGHVRRDEKGWALETSSSSWGDFSQTSESRKALQKQILEQSIRAIDEVEFSKRESASISLPANSKLTAQIKEKIQNFKNEIRELVESEKSYDEVYQLSIGFFPLTREVKKGDEI
jgi:transcriptional regulator with XRE-family HTH domain